MPISGIKRPLLLLKDLDRSAMDNFTLKRIESLRRSMISAFERLEKEGKLRDNQEQNKENFF